MRIATGGYSHETNSFGSILVTSELINRIKRDKEDFFRMGTGVRDGSGGIIAEAAELGAELIPTIYAGPGPSGPTLRKTFEEFRDELVELLWQAHCEAPLDGIALHMHGAGVAEGYNDLEGELLCAVRARFGNEIPIGVTLDLHGNITPEMMSRSDLIVGFKCYPHVDSYETARTMVNLLHRRITAGKPLGKALVKLPWHIAAGFGETLSGAAHDVQQYMCNAVEQEAELLDATFFHGFPYADIPEAGASIVTVAETQEAAERCAKQIAAYAWSRRYDFTAPINSAAEALDQAMKAPYPVVINEASDNPGGGCPGDGTHLLREMLKRNIPGSVYGFIFDPEVAQSAAQIGPGGTIDCSLGGKNDTLHGEPVALTGARVVAVSDGSYVLKNPMGAGSQRSLGITVLLQAGNVKIVVASIRIQTLDDAPFCLVGVDWQQERILALKSTHHFKGWWAGKAKTIIPCDSPGIHSADLGTFCFKGLNKSYYPFKDIAWEP